MEERKTTVEFTEEECGILCRALDEWSWDNPNINEEIYDKCTQLIERITRAL